jgi:hypothetical protein
MWETNNEKMRLRDKDWENETDKTLSKWENKIEKIIIKWKTAQMRMKEWEKIRKLRTE